MQYSTPKPDDQLKQLQTDLLNLTTEIDRDNKTKEYLTKSIAELTAKQKEIDKTVDDYKKGFSNFQEKKSGFLHYLEDKRPMLEKLKEEQKKKINDIIEAADENLTETKTKIGILKSALDKYNNDLKKAKSSLTEKQESYEELKSKIKGDQKELPDKLKKLDELKTSIGEYSKDDKEPELEEIYFFILELEKNLGELISNVKKPDERKDELYEKWQEMYVAMGIVQTNEESLRQTQKELEAKLQELERLETDRRNEILKKIGDLCETYETYES